MLYKYRCLASRMDITTVYEAGNSGSIPLQGTILMRVSYSGNYTGLPSL